MNSVKSGVFEFEFVSYIRPVTLQIAVRSGGEGQSQMLTNEAGEVSIARVRPQGYRSKITGSFMFKGG